MPGLSVNPGHARVALRVAAAHQQRLLRRTSTPSRARTAEAVEACWLDGLVGAQPALPASAASRARSSAPVGDGHDDVAGLTNCRGQRLDDDRRPSGQRAVGLGGVGFVGPDGDGCRHRVPRTRRPRYPQTVGRSVDGRRRVAGLGAVVRPATSSWPSPTARLDVHDILTLAGLVRERPSPTRDDLGCSRARGCRGRMPSWRPL